MSGDKPPTNEASSGSMRFGEIRIAAEVGRGGLSGRVQFIFLEPVHESASTVIEVARMVVNNDVATHQWHVLGEALNSDRYPSSFDVTLRGTLILGERSTAEIVQVVTLDHRHADGMFGRLGSVLDLIKHNLEVTQHD